MSEVMCLDAHVALWFVEGNPKLSPAAKVAIEQTNGPLHLSAIVLAECSRIIAKGNAFTTIENLLSEIEGNLPTLIVVPSI